MIFNNTKKIEFIDENTSLLSEDAVKMISTMKSKFDSKDSLMAYYQYIDDIISYFKQKKITIMHFGKKQAENIYSSRKELYKMLNDTETNINITVRKPNYKYYKYPLIDKILYDKSVSEWSLGNNDKLYNYANLYSAGYNNIVKKLTNGEIKSVSTISTELYNKITDEYKISSADKLRQFMENLIIPRDDLNYIELFIDNYIISLQNLKTISVNDISGQNEDTIFENKINYAIKMVDIKTMYIKNIINILLNIYITKISVFFFNNLSNSEVIVEDVNLVDILTNRTIYQESEIFINEGYSKDLMNVSNSCDKTAVQLCKEYLDTLYESALRHMDNYYCLDKINLYEGFVQLSNLDEILRSIDTLSNIDDIDLYIQKYGKLSREYRKFINAEYVGFNGDFSKLNERFKYKDKIKQSLEYDYNEIVEYIESLLSDEPTECRIRLFDRFYSELLIYVKEEIDCIETYLLNKYDIKACELDYKKIDDKYGRNVDIVEKLERYNYLTDQYSSIWYVVPTFNSSLPNNKYIDDRLLAYMLFFQNKVSLINII